MNTPEETWSVAKLGRQYSSAPFDTGALAPTWHEQLRDWLKQAVDGGVFEPNAMVLSTVDAEGAPSSRNVLLRDFSSEGLTFFTNYESRKGTELAGNPRVALLFSWLPLYRQVNIRGTAVRVPREVSAAYFASRPRGSQLASYVSPQSQVLPDRDALQRMWDEADAAFPGEVPLRDNWGGYRVVPETVEFWQGQEARMHDRLRFRRVPGADWAVERLAP
ncbi:pyridoxine/pyridoxamine 5'-phosphate oxidase [Actinorhabdospora filicis]|uniref:Pyridoxine/pyridoxamine 5'-phosphate oxidase n=1 Tax=Actinorhabdospora filicis TaxID=1785913 RepID=A0A9W6SQ31_9ACTN|nr:pyridoxamine 5'-phosphate oxidase [Actinorhabdospora filicis]GLZ80879.1 pyridoxine/pyridoxamine 5'-phosphate oxidase [Actinorhabdospora filicis]